MLSLLAFSQTALLSAMPAFLVLAGMTLLGLWGLSRLQPSLAVRLGLVGGVRQQQDAAPKGSSAELAELGSDIEELAERLAAKLDAKAARIEKLIAEADQRLAALERAERPVEVTAPSTNGNAAERAGHRAAPSGFVAARDLDPDPVSREIFRLADDGRTPAEIARELNEQIGKIQLILALRGA